MASLSRGDRMLLLIPGRVTAVSLLSTCTPVRVAHRYSAGSQAVSHGTAVEPEPLTDSLQRLTGLVVAHHLRDFVGCWRGVPNSYASFAE